MLWAPVVDDGRRFGSHLRWRASNLSKTQVLVQLNLEHGYFNSFTPTATDMRQLF